MELAGAPPLSEAGGSATLSLLLLFVGAGCNPPRVDKAAQTRGLCRMQWKNVGVFFFCPVLESMRTLAGGLFLGTRQLG